MYSKKYVRDAIRKFHNERSKLTVKKIVVPILANIIGICIFVIVFLFCQPYMFSFHTPVNFKNCIDAIIACVAIACSIIILTYSIYGSKMYREGIDVRINNEFIKLERIKEKARKEIEEEKQMDSLMQYPNYDKYMEDLQDYIHQSQLRNEEESRKMRERLSFLFEKEDKNG